VTSARSVTDSYKFRFKIDDCKCKLYVFPTPQVVAVSSGDYGMPGIFFNYELAPMMVKYTEREK